MVGWSPPLNGWCPPLLSYVRVGNSLICSLLIRSFAQIAQIKWGTVSNSLRSLRTNKWLWANCSGCSCQKSDCEQIPQIAHDKWTTVSNLLRLLMINEQIARFFWVHRSFVFCSQKTSDSLNKNLTKIIFFGTFFVSFKQKTSYLLIPSFLMNNVSESLRSLTKNERCEWIARIAHQKWATISICSGGSPKMSDHERIAKAAHQKWANERIAHYFERIAHSLIFSQ